jgi:Big-like domain-containing protein
MLSPTKVAILIGLTLFILAACRDARTVQTEPDCVLIGPTVSPPSATLHPGDTLRVRASYSPCPSGPAPSFRWRSTDTLIAMVDSVTGLVRARSLGQASIIATAVSEPALRGAMALDVKQ